MSNKHLILKPKDISDFETTDGVKLTDMFPNGLLVTFNADDEVVDVSDRPDLHIVLDGPPYFEDNEECGYCHRPIGGKHKGWCRQ